MSPLLMVHLLVGNATNLTQPSSGTTTWTCGFVSLFRVVERNESLGSQWEAIVLPYFQGILDVESLKVLGVLYFYSLPA